MTATLLWLCRPLLVLIILGLEAVVLIQFWPTSNSPRTFLNFGRHEFQYLRGFSPDGKTICSFYDERPRARDSFGFALWDVETGQLRADLKDAYGWHTFSLDGTQMAATQREGSTLVAKVWDVRTGDVRLVLGPVLSYFRGEFTPDGKGLVDVVDGATLRGLRQNDWSPFKYFSVTRGDWLNANAPLRGVVRVWDLGARKVQRSFELPAGPCQVEFSNDVRKLIVIPARFDDTTCHLWDIATGKELESFPRKLFDLDKTEAVPPKLTARAVKRLQQGHPDEGDLLRATTWGSFLFSADGRVCFRFDGEASVLQVFDGVSGREIANVPEATSLPLPKLEPDLCSYAIYAQKTAAGHVFAACSPDGSVVATEVDDLSAPLEGRGENYHHDVKLWQIPTGTELLRLPGCSNPFFSPDGKLLAVNAKSWGKGKIRVWDVDKGRWVHWSMDRSGKTVLIASAVLLTCLLAVCYFGGRRRKVGADPRLAQEPAQRSDRESG